MAPARGPVKVHPAYLGVFMYLRSIALIAFAIVPLAASAATVSPIGGDVRVSTGQGFQKIAAPTEFAAGARVMVDPQGSATIAYADDCVVTVKPASVAVVQDQVPCQAFHAPSHLGVEQATAAADGLTTQIVSEEKTTSGQSEDPMPPPMYLRHDNDQDIWGNWCLIGGVVVGVGAIAAILLSQNHDNAASPN